jgi:glucose-6-phosphate isomerase
LPPATLNSFIDHGQVQETLSENIDHGRSQLQKLAQLGIDLDAITSQLQADGVKAFAKSFESLMISITEKRDRIMAQKKDFVFQLGDLQGQVDRAIETIREGKIISRIWKHDHTVWKDDPAEITNRLGWLHSPEVMSDSVPHITDFVNTIRSEGFTHALLLGMGGSSLAPEVFRYTFGVNPGFLDLAVLDSTDPGAVLEKEKSLNPRHTLYIVSTKSGGTVETISFMKYFYNRVLTVAGAEYVGKHFIAITDPGSGLESMAKELKFRKIFLNDPNIGGRYSALSYFGLVPAALIGMDLARLLDRAARMACNCEACNCPVKGNNTCAWLGSALGEMAKIGRDKVTLIASPEITYFGAWVEQLIAESSGKEGEGILPVDGETLTMPETYASDRLFIYLRLEGDDKYDDHIQTLVTLGHPVIHLNLRDLYDLGGEFFRWEFATVIAGTMLKINPFDQPNVEAAKVLARQMVGTYQQKGELPSLQPALEDEGIKVYSNIEATGLREILRLFFNNAKADKDTVKGRSYVALQAYLKPTPETNMALQDLRSRIQSQFGLATSSGYGPRFLHSTGQLHKGDSGNGLFIQLTASMSQDVPIPDEAGKDKSSITFGILKNAQALGDRQALIDAGRNVISFDLGDEIIDNLAKIVDSI